jgi:hypothetical protein
MNRITIVDVNTISSHATVVPLSKINTIELPRLSASDARRWLNKQCNIDRKDLKYTRKELREYLDLLRWMYVRDVVVVCKLGV